MQKYFVVTRVLSNNIVVICAVPKQANNHS